MDTAGARRGERTESRTRFVANSTDHVRVSRSGLRAAQLADLLAAAVLDYRLWRLIDAVQRQRQRVMLQSAA
jgi:hypothetical protein